MKTEKYTTMKKCGLWFAAGFALLLSSTSCADHYGEEDSVSQPQGETVEVGFSLKVGSLAAGDDATYSLFQTGGEPQTRVIPDNIKDGADALIRNLWVIQFEDGIGGDVANKKMVGVPRFISGSDLDNNAQSGTVQLIATAEPCYIVWVANCEDYRWNLPLNATFADVAAKMIRLSAEADTWPDIPVVGGEPTILMNAITETSIQSGVDLEPVFSRNYARVTLNLKIGSDDCQINSVRLRNVPINVTLSELSLGPDYTNTVPDDATIYPYGSPLMDYDIIAVDDLKTEGDTKEFTWYVPRNQQGVINNANLTKYNDKNYYAPINATYFEVVAQRKGDSETSVFRVYPGGNQINDFTLLPNHAYTSSLNVKGIGDQFTTDSRVENFADVVYTEDDAANCYILNPAPEGGRTRKYSIPITHAITYWSRSEKGYGNDQNNVIGTGQKWQASILWGDHADTDKIKLDNDGIGYGPKDKFIINVPAGIPELNFTVRLTRHDSDEVLWSWHFWVTNYNPDAFDFNYIDHSTSNPGGVPAGIFTYPVPNGQVERYDGTIWTTGAYKNRVMMDRPLGALENYFTAAPSPTTRGYLVYQFGRKDPFPPTTTVDGVGELPFGAKILSRTTSDADRNSTVTIKEGVQNPAKFYNKRDNRTTWCNEGGGFGTPGYVWFDPNAVIINMTEGTDYTKKSIYDPCPPGWKVPVRGVWSGFTHNVTAIKVERDLGWSNGRGVDNINALRYWPGGADSPVGGRIYYAASGWREGRSAAVESSTVNGYTWTASPFNSSNTSSFHISFSATSLDTTTGGTAHSCGIPVRCVSANE